MFAVGILGDKYVGIVRRFGSQFRMGGILVAQQILQCGLPLDGKGYKINMLRGAVTLVKSQ
jgi:hypothetical protein